jgi:mono/diheme cytochrome c family protein
MMGLVQMRIIWVGALTLAVVASAAAEAREPAAERGHTFVAANCGKCHAVEQLGESPLSIAPPFRALHLKYPIDDLGEALAEGITTGHPTMPEFRLDPAQINDVLSYLKTLR